MNGARGEETGMLPPTGPYANHQTTNQTDEKEKEKKHVLMRRLHYVILWYMVLSSARSFLKDGLSLASYCQQLFIILEISTGQP